MGLVPSSCGEFRARTVTYPGAYVKGVNQEILTLGTLRARQNRPGAVWGRVS